MNKKIGIIIAPLMALAFMANCGGNKSLEQCSWEEIKEISKSGEAYKRFKIGDTKTVIIGDVSHTVRIIGFNHDYNADLSGNTNGITFEFANMISDVSGLSLATFWNDFDGVDKSNDSFKALDYKNSSLRAALVGKKGDGETNNPNWFRYYGEDHDENTKYISESDPYYHKSVYDLLPDDLKGVITNAIKIVNKCTGLDSDNNPKFEIDYITDPLFLLSPVELGYTGSFHEIYTTPYQYYSNHQDRHDSIRVKKQTDNMYGHIGFKAAEEGGFWEEHQPTHSRNYAGCFYTAEGEGRESTGYWLRSVSNENTKPCAFAVRHETGFVYDYDARQNAFGVAPAFCI